MMAGENPPELLEDLALVEVEAVPAAVIHLKIPREVMAEEMPSAINEILGVLGAQNQEPAGPMFAHHLALSDETFDFEAGFPVARPVAASGRVTPGSLPAGKVVRAIYRGPYEGLYRAWAEFGGGAEDLLDQHHLTPGESVWERYLEGPETHSDPARYRTELNRPVVASG